MAARGSRSHHRHNAGIGIIPVVDDGAEPEDGLGSLHAPPGACDIEAVADHSLNNQHELEGSDVATGQGNHADTQGQVGLVLTSSSEEEAGEAFRAGCPLSAALRSRSLPLRHVDRELPVRVVTHRQGRSPV
jgi:hypothetical protein